jgi:Amt family ammonium transporter
MGVLVAWSAALPCTACAVHGLRLSHEQEFQGADLSLHRIGATSQD